MGTWSLKLNVISQDVFNGTGYRFIDINGLFNHAVNTSDFTVSSDGMISEQCIVRNVEGSSYGLI